jgi:hypothetical protein
VRVNVVGTGSLAKHRVLDWMRVHTAPRLANGRDVVNVDVETLSSHRRIFPGAFDAALRNKRTMLLSTLMLRIE